MAVPIPPKPMVVGERIFGEGMGTALELIISLIISPHKNGDTNSLFVLFDKLLLREYN